MKTDPGSGAMSAVGSAREAADGSPRNSLTGAEITNAGESAVIDWLAFTVSGSKDGVELTAADWALRLAGESDLPALDRGANGYDAGFRLPGNGLILYNANRPDMGVHCSLPSGALAALPYGPVELIGAVFAVGGHFTRVDVALDSHTIAFNQVKEACKRGDVVTRANEINYGDTDVRRDGKWEYGGAIIRIGSRSSRRFVRIYDKAAQTGTDGIWTRCEVEFKSDSAQLAAVHILNGENLQSLVYSSIDFRDCAADSNTSRCPQLDWWADWVGMVNRVSFAVKTVEKTVVQVYTWVQKQVAPALAFLDDYFDRDSTWLYRLCDENKDRVPLFRRQMIEATPLPQRLEVAAVAALSDPKAGNRSRPEKRQGINGLLDTLLAAGVPREDLDMHLIMGAA